MRFEDLPPIAGNVDSGAVFGFGFVAVLTAFMLLAVLALWMRRRAKMDGIFEKYRMRGERSVPRPRARRQSGG